MRNLVAKAIRYRRAKGLRGHVDQPVQDVLTRGPVLFSGWAFAGHEAPNALEVVVDGKHRTAAEIHIDRPDVPIALGEAAVDWCGWAAMVDLTGHSAGNRKVQIVARDAKNKKAVIVDRIFEVLDGELPGSIDEPSPGDVIEGELLVVSGWALCPTGIGRVEIAIDGVVIGRARVGLPRPDVRKYLDASAAHLIGYEYRDAVRGLDDGQNHVVSVVITAHGQEPQQVASIPVTFRDLHASQVDNDLAKRLGEQTELLLERPTSGHTATKRSVMVFTHGLVLGGGELYLQDLLRQMVPQLASCTLVAPVGGPLAAELEDLGVDVVIDPREPPTNIRAVEGSVRNLAMMMKEANCTSVVVNTLGQWVAAAAAERAGIPVIWAIHESFSIPAWMSAFFKGRRPDPGVRACLEQTLRNASRVVFEADATREIYARSVGLSDSAVTVPYGVDIKALANFAAKFDRLAARRRHSIPDDAQVLLCMGVLQDRKSQGLLVEAFARVAEKYPRAVLALVGDQPCPYSSAVRAEVASNGLEDRVRLEPITPDTWEWYGLADVLVSASDVESLPRSMLEAMALGCPVLSASVFGVPELISDGETGWLMEARDGEAFTAGIERVLGFDDADLRSVAQAGRDLVFRNHDIHGYPAAYLKMIDEFEH